MKRLKFFLGTSLLALTLYVLGTTNAVNKQHEEVAASVVHYKKLINENRQQLQQLRKKRLQEALNVYFQKAIRNNDIVGAAVSIVKGNNIVVSEGYGERNAQTKALVDGATVFRLGSLSKGFAGVLVADLKSEGKASWDDKITDYIPEFQLGDASNTANIKLKHILSHTSGAPYHSFTNLVEAGLDVDAIAKRFNEVDPVSKPGEQYSYQNAIFSLSQEVMRKATGRSTKTLLNDRFFKPLKMTSVSMSHSDLIATKNKALPHVKRRTGWNAMPLKDRYYNAVTAGGINASAEDMGKWMRFLLGRNPDVMESAEIQEAFTPFISFKNHRKYYQRWEGHLKSSYGFGWRIHQLQDIKKERITIWHHGGSVNNFRNEIAIFPESDLGICVLINSQSKIAKTVIPDLYELVQKVYLNIPTREYMTESVNTQFHAN